MSDERDIPQAEPTYPADLHPDVVGECRKYWAMVRPWTKLRVLQKGSDNPEGARCGGSQGEFHQDCPKKVEAVQYSTAYGEPLWFCEGHALKQADWDVILYDSKPRPPREMSAEDKAWIERFLARGKKKNKQPEPEEFDP